MVQKQSPNLPASVYVAIIALVVFAAYTVVGVKCQRSGGKPYTKATIMIECRK